MRNIMKTNNEQGTALIATLIFLVAMGILSTTLVFTVNNEMKTSASYKYSQQAFYIADAGIQEAVRWFSDTAYDASAYLGQYNLTTLPPSFGSGSTAPQVTIGQSGGSWHAPSGFLTAFQTAFDTSQNTLPVGSYSGVYVVSAKLLRHTPAHFISATMNSETPNGTGGYNSSVERWQVESIGYWGTSANPLGVSKITAIIQNDGDAFFDRALWGIDSVDLTGTSLIDSYDPRFPYDLALNSGHMGDIGSNGDITGGGSAQVKGIVACQAGHVCDPPSGVDATITLDAPRTFNPIEAFTTGSTKLSIKNKESDSFKAADGRYSSVTVASGGILTIPAAVWYMDSLDVKGDIIVSGDATLYIASSMDVSAQSIVNGGGTPQNLNVFYSGNVDSKWTGGVGVTATVYSPNAGLTLRGSAAFYGSFIAESIDNAGNCEVHFDQGSLKRNLIRRPFRIITWSRNSL